MFALEIQKITEAIKDPGIEKMYKLIGSFTENIPNETQKAKKHIGLYAKDKKQLF